MNGEGFFSCSELNEADKDDDDDDKDDDDDDDTQIW